MKSEKKRKHGLRAGLACVGVGALFCVGAYGLGGQSVIRADNLNIEVGPVKVAMLVDRQRVSSQRKNQTAIHHDEIVEEQNHNSGQSMTIDEAIDSVQIDISAGNLILQSGPKAQIEMGSTEDLCWKDLDQSVTNHNWSISQHADHDFIPLFSNSSDLVVTIPERVKSIEIHSAMGMVTVQSLKTDSLLVDASAGDLQITDSTIGTLQTDLSAGSLSLEKTTVNDADLSLSAGEVSGDFVKVLNALQATVSMGSIYLNLADSQSFYNLDLDTSLGQIVLGDEMTIANGSYHPVHQKGRPTIELSVSAGEIMLNFSAGTLSEDTLSTIPSEQVIEQEAVSELESTTIFHD